MSWVTCNIGDALQLIQNGINCKQSKDTIGDKISRIETISDANVNFSKVGFAVLSENEKVKAQLHKNDILFSHINSPIHVGKTAHFNGEEPLFHGINLLRLRVNENIDSRFFNYFLNRLFWSGHWKRTAKQSVNQASVNQTDIKGVSFSYPPIPEQQRIVAILDQAFADIEKARANAEQNLKNILELYLSNKQEIFGRSILESQMINLTSVCENIFAGGDAPKKGLYSKIETDNYKIPIYANAVKDAGLYGFTDYFRVDKPSITIAARGSGTGHIELRRDSFLPIVRLIVLIPLTETLSLEYFKHALQNLDILRSGSAIPQLTVPMIKEYSIPVPSLDSQLSIVDEIESLGGYIEECKKLYEQKLASLDELKKSLLQKAFSGELTKGEGRAA